MAQRAATVRFEYQRHAAVSRYLHVHVGGRAQRSALIVPGPHVAVFPGRHSMAHEAHAPTAGALHVAPIGFLSFLAALVFLWLCSSAASGAVATRSAAKAATNRVRMDPPSSWHVNNWWASSGASARRRRSSCAGGGLRACG